MSHKIALVFLVAAALVLSFLDSTTIENLYRSLLTVVGLGGVKAETVSDFGHIVAGFFLTLLALTAFPRRTAAVLSVLLFFFVIIELLQGLTVTRSMSLGDVIRSAAGIGCGVLVSLSLRSGDGMNN